jgi:hypothetical protein
MNWKFGVTLTVFMLLLISLFAGAESAQAQGVAGVSQGQVFTYHNFYLWDSTNPADTPPAYLSGENDSTFLVTIKSVSGSTVNLQKVWIYQNGTTTAPTTDYAEVNTHGVLNDVLVYAANLDAGGALFPGDLELQFNVNETVIRNYGQTVRETNHVVANNTSIEGTLYSYMDLYFDKETGMAVEYYWTTVYTSMPNQAFTQHLVLADTNAWMVTTSPSPSGSPSTQVTLTPSTSPSETEPPSQTDNNWPLSIPLLVTIIAAVVIVAAAAVLLLAPKKKPAQPAESAPHHGGDPL